jgi:hypothetical protein
MTAWQNAETFAAGVASSVREAYWTFTIGVAGGFGPFAALLDLFGGLEDGGSAGPEVAWVVF